MPEGGAHRTAELAARASYGRLLARLAATTRDVGSAEDALATAFAAALEGWPRTGVPDSPEAWLLTAARRSFIDGVRRGRVRDAGRDMLALLAEEADAGSGRPVDDRLGLLFVCAHPAIDPAARTPLMLQTVLGLDAARIARAFQVPAATMGQRLVRAKAKIRDAGIGFALPEADDLAPRLEAVLDAIYAAYGTGWDAIDGEAGDPDEELTGEAVWLGRLVLASLPEEPEAAGLLALMLHCEARRLARRAADGSYVPLDEQDTRLWSPDRISEAETLLHRAVKHRRFGRYQLEAAIQSAHAGRARTGETPWAAIVTLYDQLMILAPSTGAAVARAAATGRAQGPAAGLALLNALAGSAQDYQPYWAVRAHLLAELGDPGAAVAFAKAMALTASPALRAHLARRAATDSAGARD